MKGLTSTFEDITKATERYDQAIGKLAKAIGEYR